MAATSPDSARMGKFSYRDAEAFDDGEDAFYRSFWDNEGSLHWGVFDDRTGRDSRS